VRLSYLIDTKDVITSKKHSSHRVIVFHKTLKINKNCIHTQNLAVSLWHADTTVRYALSCFKNISQ
jgi:hypothetical protein